jgi:membrane protease YdiL (CAAX protease family)
MWMPGLGAIIATRLGDKQEFKTLGLGKLGNKKTYLWAWLGPILAVILTGTITWLLGWGKFDTSFTLIKQSLEGLPEVPESTLPLLLTAQIAASFTLAPLFNTLFAMGEELGWRGYLLPKLLVLGEIPAMLISGVIWGLWHAPVILQGHNYPEHPLLGVGMMIVFTVLLGIFFSWLYLKTKSPWAPALGHGTVNAVAGLPLLFLTGVDLTLGGALTSVSGWLALAALVGVLYWKKQIPLGK